MAKGILRSGLLPLVLLIALCLWACEKKEGHDGEHVTYRLKWLFNTSVAGDLYAEAHGIFQDYGLRVSIKEGGPERDAIKELELGHADFGVASADQVIRARSKGAPIVVIAQLFQENPLQWIFRPETVSIRNVQDLKGKTIGVTFGGNDETIMRALMAKHHITSDEVSLFSVRYDYTPFYQGEVDLWPVYQNAQGIIIGEKLRKAGEKIAFFRPAAFGIRFVANSVVTTQRMLEEHPAVVHRFVSALMKGWAEALRPANEERAVATIHRFDRDTPVVLIRKQLRATRALIRPAADMAIGNIDVAAWAQTETMMLAQKLIPGPVQVEGILKRDLLNALE
jgi:NitT/TauT family transport system substrate-binding protein